MVPLAAVKSPVGVGFNTAVAAPASAGTSQHLLKSEVQSRVGMLANQGLPCKTLPESHAALKVLGAAGSPASCLA